MLGQPTADALPIARSHGVRAPQKRDRSKRLTKIDMRSVLGQRVKELTKAFSEALGTEQSILRRMAIERAAQLTAIAEKARGKLMRDGAGTLDDLVRLERKADQAVRALGISEGKPKPATSNPLVEHFSRPSAREAAE